jgi:hypothetical protein
MTPSGSFQAAFVSLGANGKLGSLVDMIYKCPMLAAAPFCWSPGSFVWQVAPVGSGWSMSPTAIDDYSGAPTYASLRQDFKGRPTVVGLQDASGNWITSVGPSETFGITIHGMMIASITCANGQLASADKAPINPGSNLPLWYLNADPGATTADASWFVVPRSSDGAPFNLKLAPDITSDDVASAVAAVGADSGVVHPILEVVAQVVALG